jgi:hypothetical protein
VATDSMTLPSPALPSSRRRQYLADRMRTSVDSFVAELADQVSEFFLRDPVEAHQPMEIPTEGRRSELSSLQRLL